MNIKIVKNIKNHSVKKDKQYIVKSIYFNNGYKTYGIIDDNGNEAYVTEGLCEEIDE